MNVALPMDGEIWGGTLVQGNAVTLMEIGYAIRARPSTNKLYLRGSVLLRKRRYDGSAVVR